MAEKRINRSHENRNSQERPKSWTPPSTLPEPEKDAGYEYRWVRTSTLNDPDPRNVSMKLREGWEPVKAEEQPHMKLMADVNSRHPGCIEIGGLLLCKTPSEFVQQRNEHYLTQAKQQMESVDNNLMRESDPRAPIFKEHKTSVSFGKGK
jgi:hypothetical protein